MEIDSDVEEVIIPADAVDEETMIVVEFQGPVSEYVGIDAEAEGTLLTADVVGRAAAVELLHLVLDL